MYFNVFCDLTFYMLHIYSRKQVSQTVKHIQNASK